MRKAMFAIVAVALLAFAGTAIAGKAGTAVPWKYDPYHTGDVVANWTKDGLSLQKNTETSTWASAGAEIKGVEGETLTSLSFEMKDGTYCGAGAPRFNVRTADVTSFLGCSYGQKSAAGEGWMKVTFTGVELAAAGVSGAAITAANIVMDEQGKTLLRNISVNDVAITR